jgi:hypothetical protein
VFFGCVCVYTCYCACVVCCVLCVFVCLLFVASPAGSELVEVLEIIGRHSAGLRIGLLWI